MPDLDQAPPTDGPEPGDAACEPVPANLVELHEVLEWQDAMRARAAAAAFPDPSEHGLGTE